MNQRQIHGYHAHVYFDASSADKARALRAMIQQHFDIQMGRFFEREVGPHPCWSYQVAFRSEQFGDLVPWLVVNRDGLTVFVRGISGDDIYDHTALTLWLGESVPLRLEALR